MTGYKITIVDNRFDEYKEERDVFEKFDAEIKICRSLDENEVAETVKDSDAVIVNLAHISKKVIENMKKCRIISRYGVGYDNVDVDTATKSEIWVANVPDYSMEDVSDHALALLLTCVRKISYKDRKIREGEWNLHKELPIHRIKDRTMGFIGYGSIAKALHRKMSGLGLYKFLVYDPYVSNEVIDNDSTKKVDFKTLLKESDYISIHVPLNEKTRGMFGDEEFNIMKNSAIIINTSRGGIIKEESLVNALKNNVINYAGLDVFETEPLPENYPLLKLDNVVLTDHAAYYSEESLIELKTKTAINVREVLKGRPPVYPVNNIK